MPLTAIKLGSAGRKLFKKKNLLHLGWQKNKNDKGRTSFSKKKIFK
jgi:hypothetical protein